MPQFKSNEEYQNQEEEFNQTTEASEDVEKDTETTDNDSKSTRPVGKHGVICQCGKPMYKKQTVYECSCKTKMVVPGDVEGQQSLSFDEKPKETMIELSVVADLIAKLENSGCFRTLKEMGGVDLEPIEWIDIVIDECPEVYERLGKEQN